MTGRGVEPQRPTDPPDRHPACDQPHAGHLALQVCVDLLQARIPVFELLPPPHLLREKPALPFLPAATSRLADPGLATDLRDRCAAFAMVQDERLLRLPERRCRHAIARLSEPENSTGNCSFKRVGSQEAEHRDPLASRCSGAEAGYRETFEGVVKAAGVAGPDAGTQPAAGCALGFTGFARSQPPIPLQKNNPSPHPATAGIAQHRRWCGDVVVCRLSHGEVRTPARSTWNSPRSDRLQKGQSDGAG